MFIRNMGDGMDGGIRRSLIPPNGDVVSDINRCGKITTNEFIRQVSLALEEFFNADIYLDERCKIVCKFPLSSAFEMSIFKL